MADNMPESRRKMIDLMYLVLTALLALNVTREVLDAFDTLTVSIERSNGSITQKNNQIYDAFNAEMLTADSVKVKPWLAKANQVKAQTADIMKYLEGWKDSLILKSGGLQMGVAGDSVLKNREDVTTATHMFVDKSIGNQMKARLQDYVKSALSLIDSLPARKGIADQFPLEVKDLPKTQDNPKGDWAVGTFNNIPVTAGVAMISKFQNDVKNSESVLLEYFEKQIHMKDFKFNTLAAVAVPNTTYALEGQPITATVMLAAYNKDARGMSISSSAGAVPVKDGVGNLEFKASGIGSKTVNGVITVDNNGEKKSYTWKFDYTVGTAGASLQLDKMNVMYIGVPNPITLSASGYNIEDVSLGWEGGSGINMSASGKGQYTATCTKPGTYKYFINAKSRTGATGQVGGGQIRVKRIPDPVAEVAHKSSGLVPTGVAKAQGGVVADLKNFDFEARFVVTEFQFIWIPLNGQAVVSSNTGAAWNSTVQQYVSRSKPGDKWVISNIRAKGPDGTTRDIGSVTLTLN